VTEIVVHTHEHNIHTHMDGGPFRTKTKLAATEGSTLGRGDISVYAT
jgi:hypothetical protein